MLGRYSKSPTNLHMELVKQVVMYIAWTRDMIIKQMVR
jgi:hypothetical protein